MKALPLFDIRLREYQREAIAAIRTDWADGAKAVLIEMPTGCGKTRTFVMLPPENSRTLVIVPQINLITQTVKAIRQLRGCEPDIEQADLNAIPESEFTVASWQSLIRNDRYFKFCGKVDTVIVDEAHWGFTTAGRAILQALMDAGSKVLGCTATAYRADRQSLLGFYERVSYCYSLRQAIDDGWLVPPKVKVHYVQSINLGKLAKKAAADFPPEELDRILRSEEALQDLASLIRQNHVAGRKGIVFAHSVKQACLMRDILLDRFGMVCSLVHSYQKAEEYETELHEFTHGDRELIINVGILTTGWDHPPVSEIFLAKPTKALSKYTQMIGRATRTHGCQIDEFDTPESRKAAILGSGKPHFTVHDITDSSRCHQLCSALDVLGTQSRELKVKVRDKLTEEASVEEIDAAVEAELAAEREAARLEREAERKRRAGLVVGVTFSSEDRDPFAEPDRDNPRRKEWRMPFGKYKGQPMTSKFIPDSYLHWALEKGHLTAKWRQVFLDAVERRRQMKGGRR